MAAHVDSSLRKEQPNDARVRRHPSRCFMERQATFMHGNSVPWCHEPSFADRSIALPAQESIRLPSSRVRLGCIRVTLDQKVSSHFKMAMLGCLEQPSLDTSLQSINSRSPLTSLMRERDTEPFRACECQRHVHASRMG
jgi:hypothetical protein